jgi:hypothetical protein
MVEDEKDNSDYDDDERGDGHENIDKMDERLIFAGSSPPCPQAHATNATYHLEL